MFASVLGLVVEVEEEMQNELQLVSVVVVAVEMLVQD